MWIDVDEFAGRAAPECSDIATYDKSARCLHAGDTPSDLVLRWAHETFEHLNGLFNSTAEIAAGAQLISGYHLWQVGLICVVIMTFVHALPGAICCHHCNTKDQTL